MNDFKGLLSPDRVIDRQEDLLTYAFDGTAVLNTLPACVVFPQNAGEVAAVLKFASERKIPVVTRGSGTGLSGGSVPSSQCIVLCTVKFNRILEVDTRNLTMTVEPGVVTQKIFEEAEKVGLFYPPDPGSMKISTIGGNVAENSGGLRGLKYGVTRDYVMGLEVVLPTGEIIWMGNKCVKDVAGYNLKDVFIGSEGTLGVMTKVLLKLIPKPKAKKTMLAVFDRMDQAAETVSAIIENKIIPCTLEFLDKITIRCVEDYAKIGLPLDAEAVLLMETDGHPAAVEDEAALMAQIAKECGAREVKVARDTEEALRIASARRSAFSSLARVSPTTILEDATVPRSELAKMVRFIQEVAARHHLRVGTFGHMGDGNLHPTFLTDEKNHEEMERVEKAMVEIFDFAVSLGGTITGEHGVGLAKKPFLEKALGSLNIRVMKHLKAAFDPAGILNPGKIFD
ncbi:MAG: FAD-linked oxidase C-terminal domain-containing protein [Verrucomicrobiae bacterium]|nr:FAD-linked oxidase C-terminal domain-containing protein [Verrucomicrobiae bacterium]